MKGAARRLFSLGWRVGLAAVLLAGSAWTWAQRDLSRRRGEVQDLQSQQQQVAQKHADFVKAKARLEHLRAFLGTRADWTSQLNRINQQLPDPPAAVIEELRASLSADVRFELPKDGGKGYARGKWDPRRSVVFGVAGRVRQRDVADDLRLRLLDEYLVEPRGADVADRFDYQLTQRPPAPAKADGPGAKPAALPKTEPAKPATASLAVFSVFFASVRRPSADFSTSRARIWACL